jgi:epoxyqueuosine reductase
MGELVYGCDICQDVCPWNERFATDLREDAFRPREIIASNDPRTIALALLAMDDASYRSAFRGSAMKRAKRPGLARNAAVALGNVGTADDVNVLTKSLEDPDALVRDHAAWALERIRQRM